jgi:hypothetical protein
MSEEEVGWFDEDAGPLARPYTLTRGRTHSARLELGLVTLVVALRQNHGGELDHAHERILRSCEKPQSVAEVAAGANLPLGVVKVLISDLIERNYMIFRSGWGPASRPGEATLQKVLDGFRKL